jgi:serine protease inhibitor
MDSSIDNQRERATMRSTTARAVAACWTGWLCLAGCNSGITPEAAQPGDAAPVGTATTSAAPLSSTATTPSALPSPTSQTAIAASNAFGLDLYRRLATKQGNLAMSPASLSVALSMTYGGAKGPTAAEMAKVMHLPDPEALHSGWATVLSRWGKGIEHVELRVANRLFGDKSFSFEKPFLALTADRYAAPLEPRDFKGAPEAQRIYINGWVEERTKEKIADLIPPKEITADTRLVLANALYLKAPWEGAFNADLTKKEIFYAHGTKEVKAPLMSRVAHFRFAETADVLLVELDYQGGELAMLVALPKQRAGLAAVEGKLDAELLRGWVGQLKGERVWLSLPRFKVDPSEPLALKEPLQAMGMKLAFLRGAADFTGMANPSNPEDRLSIGNVFHKAFVAVDEKGTEAAAASAVVMYRAGGKAAEPTRVKVDHPFLFFIRDLKTEALLFVGRVVDPSGS